MEKELSFVVVLSLKEMAMRSVVVNLLKESGILSRFRDFFPSNFRHFLHSLQNVTCTEQEITDKMSKLKCPESLLQEMSAIVTPIGLQMENWLYFNVFYLEKPGWRTILAKYFIDSHVQLDLPFLSKLCFTTAGTIDYRKTAQELVDSKMLDVVKCYELACLYCLEDCIPKLWKKLPKEIKRKFYSGKEILRIVKPDLRFCWPYILKGKLSMLDYITFKYYRYPITFDQHAFEYTAREGNKSAAKYFLGKLTQEEKDASFARIEFRLADSIADQVFGRSAFPFGKFSLESRTDVLCCLLSQMNHKQQMNIFKKQSGYVLDSFLSWPWQDLFLKISERTWAFLPSEDYDSLLEQMYLRFTESKYSFAKLFREFFPHSPENFRKAFVDNECRGAHYFFPGFFDLPDSDSVKVMFRNVSAEDRMRLVSSEHIFPFFHHSILINKLNMVKLCFREATLSKLDRENLKVAFVIFGSTRRSIIKLQTQVQNRFNQLLDQIYGENKRSSEYETLNKSKKLCSNE